MLLFAIFLFHSQDFQLTIATNTLQLVDLQSFAGQKLVRRGDFHVGAQINTMVRIKRREIVRRDNPVTDQMMMTDEESESFAELCLCGEWSWAKMWKRLCAN